MTSEFITFLQLGFEHILDIEGYDHLLFVVGLCAIYRPKDWRRIALLITAFTIGHCFTLILAGRYGSWLAADLIEQLVAFTIFLGGAYNLAFSQRWHQENIWPAYLLAAGFGLIHGMAFSNFFRALGSEADELWRQLLAFNLGVEGGQLVIVFWFFLLTMLILSVGGSLVGKDPKSQDQLHRRWSMLVSTIVACAGLYLLVGRL